MTEEPCQIGSRLELFVDDWIIEKMDGVEQRLHHPIPREKVMAFDRPWEGNTCAYVTVFRDGDLFRMYYRGSYFDWETRKETHNLTCYAESEDGINWKKPELGLFEFEGSKRNNIVWMGIGVHNFTPFKDTNPDCKPGVRYKALAGIKKEGGLFAFQSGDGIHWSLIQSEPVITKGGFDSQNLAFWDGERGTYLEFHRALREKIRDIMTSTSKDFIHWTEPRFLDFGDAPLEHLYTNAIIPYFRAPHILLGFPKRFLPGRKKIMDHPYPGVSDGVLMSSRDGVHWHRWMEAFARPGLQRERWWERNNMTSWGILLTEPDIRGLPGELSFYLNEGHYEEGGGFRRFTLRMDGFVSIHGSFTGGEVSTRPLVFNGRELILNYSTSAAGSIRVEITDGDGRPIPGFELGRCPEIYGDEIEYPVKWESDPDLGELTGRTVRLRFELKDADLFSFRFRS